MGKNDKRKTPKEQTNKGRAKMNSHNKRKAPIERGKRREADVFSDLSKMPNEEIQNRIDLIQYMIDKRDRDSKLIELAKNINEYTRHIENLKKKQEDLGTYLEDKKDSIFDKQEYKDKENEYKVIEQDIEMTGDEIERAKQEEDIIKSKASNRQKLTNEELAVMVRYNRLTNEKLLAEGKRLFIYQQIKEDLRETKNILNVYKRERYFEKELKRMEEYFEEFDKKEILTFDQKKEHEEMLKKYSEISKRKMFIEQAKLKRKEQGIDERKREGEAKRRLEYLTNKDNWDDILASIIAMEEERNNPEQNPPADPEQGSQQETEQNPPADPEQESQQETEQNPPVAPEQGAQQNSNQDITEDETKINAEYDKFIGKHPIIAKIPGVGKVMRNVYRKQLKESRIHLQFWKENGEFPSNTDMFKIRHPRLAGFFNGLLEVRKQEAERVIQQELEKRILLFEERRKNFLVANEQEVETLEGQNQQPEEKDKELEGEIIEDIEAKIEYLAQRKAKLERNLALLTKQELKELDEIRTEQVLIARMKEEEKEEPKEKEEPEEPDR